MPLLFRANRFYQEESVPLPIGTGISQVVTLQLHRDATFSVFAGSVFDGDCDDYSSHPVEGASVTVGPCSATTDARGAFRLEIPLEAQREVLPVSIRKEGFRPFSREEETPDPELCYLLHR